MVVELRNAGALSRVPRRKRSARGSRTVKGSHGRRDRDAAHAKADKLVVIFTFFDKLRRIAPVPNQ